MTIPTTPSGDGSAQPSFIAIIDVGETLAESVLEELTREGIAAYAEPLQPPHEVESDSTPDQVRIHVDRSRVPVARAIISSRLPQVGSQFLSPRDTPASTMSTQEVDEAWARLIQGWDPATEERRIDRDRGGSGLSDRLIRRHGPNAPDSPDALSPTPTPQESANPASSAGPRDYFVDQDLFEEEGFSPPEPPPLPRPQHAWDIVGWSGAIGGPLVLVANQVLAWGGWISGVAIAAFAGGFAVLITRMRDERDHDDPGAVV